MMVPLKCSGEKVREVEVRDDSGDFWEKGEE